MKKIYTKRGDRGETFLLSGKRVSKVESRVEACGAIDELNSVVGVVIAQVQSSKFKVQSYNLKFKNELFNIQKDLFEIGSILANPSTKSIRELEDRISSFEKTTDDLSKELPELKNFILPGGGVSSSLLHWARAVCRRTERRTVELSRKEVVDQSIIAYLNRLSDLLFTMARFVNCQERKKEEIYKRIIG